MKGNFKIEGILPAIVTPLEADNRTVNEAVTRKLTEYFLENGANGFYILGGTGEGIVLDINERQRMCEIMVDQVKGRKPVIDHVAAINITDAIQLAKHAEKAGADALASVPPTGAFFDEEDIYQYYKALAGSTNLPVFVYYSPTSVTMSAKLLARIFEIDNVVGVKWSTYNYYEMMHLKEITHGEMMVINGPDEMLINGLASGADAGVGATYNVMLPQFVSLYNEFKAGNVDKAREIQYTVNRAIRPLIKYEVIPSIKAALGQMGFAVGQATFPMRQFDDKMTADFMAELKATGWPFNK
ncbi:MAG: dihydrodipicolinate synthase family protein [Clostridia bacterium]|nr:dihydrodipicolinate synthase family protein [Clostridia bacterium]MBR2926715.1 dihydrodipicolinate synthase family protein [Clostridia bacterium]